MFGKAARTIDTANVYKGAFLQSKLCDVEQTVRRRPMTLSKGKWWCVVVSKKIPKPKKIGCSS
jgi:hypothetical protein